MEGEWVAGFGIIEAELVAVAWLGGNWVGGEWVVR